MYLLHLYVKIVNLAIEALVVIDIDLGVALVVIPGAGSIKKAIEIGIEIEAEEAAGL